jgi:hypothetical protein
MLLLASFVVKWWRRLWASSEVETAASHYRGDVISPACVSSGRNTSNSPFRKRFSGVFQYEEELHSREELIQKIEEFFTTPVQEIKRRLESR